MPQAELLARKIIRRASLPPGSAPSEIAHALGIHVSVRHNLGEGVRGSIDPLLRSIYLAPCKHRPRAEWVVGHELAELELADHQGDGHEDLCQGIAAAILMPAEQFIASAESFNWDLASLRQWWTHCSWQSLARRAIELLPGASASAWVGSRCRFREWHEGPRPSGEADDLEAFVATESVGSGRNSRIELGGVRVRAWATGPRRAVALCESS